MIDLVLYEIDKKLLEMENVFKNNTDFKVSLGGEINTTFNNFDELKEQVVNYTNKVLDIFNVELFKDLHNILIDIISKNIKYYGLSHIDMDGNVVNHYVKSVW
jgi:hypothetical protein